MARSCTCWRPVPVWMDTIKAVSPVEVWTSVPGVRLAAPVHSFLMSFQKGGGLAVRGLNGDVG